MASKDVKPAPGDRVFATGLDWHLQLLVEDANDFGVEVPITLFVPGAVVTGVLTSGKDYFELFADRFAAGWPKDGRAAIRASMASPGEVYPRLEPGQKSPRGQPAQFIHLRDAQLVGAFGGLPSGGDGLLWRGRLSEVAAYSLGRLVAGPGPAPSPLAKRPARKR
jgi:hypothetical protein